MIKTHDLLHHYRGFAPGELLCRVQVFEQPGEVPVVVVSELAWGDGPRLARVEPYLAAEILARYLPGRFEESEPVRWVEHRERSDWELRRNYEEFALVEFASYVPRIETRAGFRRVRVGRARWTRVPRDVIEDLIDQPLD